MSLLPDVIVERLRDMPGATHSFLRQLCEPEGVEIREGLERALQAMPPSLGQMLRERLSSLDNRVFFQGFSELVVASVLSRAGWEVSAGSPGGLLRGTRPGGEHTNVLVLGFIHSHRPGLDQSGVRRLVQALERVATNLRFAV